MYLKLPRYVKQTMTNSCWAAGMESWLEQVPYGAKRTQAELIAEYATQADGGLVAIASNGSGRDFESLASDFSIEYAVLRGSTLTLDYIDDKLRYGHVIVAYNMGPNSSHANVVYGVGYPTGGQRMVSVMDPNVTTSHSSTGLYRNRVLSFYSSRTFLIVGWPEPW